MRNKAKFAGNGEHFVLSAPNGLARAYIVDREPGLDLADEVPPPESVVKAALGLQEMFLQSYGTLKVRVREPASSQGFSTSNAYDVVGNLNLRSQVSLALRDPSRPLTSVSANVGALRAMVHNAVGWSEEPQITVTLEFHDGTTVDYAVNLVKETADYVPGSARTAGGEVIQDESNMNVGGVWTDDLARMREHMQRLGFTFNRVGCGMIIETITCTWSQPTLTCSVKYSGC